jgi:hypothetical protein
LSIIEESYYNVKTVFFISEIKKPYGAAHLEPVPRNPFDINYPDTRMRSIFILYRFAYFPKISKSGHASTLRSRQSGSLDLTLDREQSGGITAEVNGRDIPVDYYEEERRSVNDIGYCNLRSPRPCSQGS